MQKSHLDPLDFAKFLKKLATQAGLTNNKLSIAIGIAHASIANWSEESTGNERTVGAPSCDALGKIAKYLGLDLWELMLIIQRDHPIPVKEIGNTLDWLSEATEKELELLAKNSVGSDANKIARAQMALANMMVKSMALR
jgi:transcriptional regulator with XRE-family HTH domain